MAILISVTVLAHLIIPLLFLLWIWKSKVSSKIQWLGIVWLAGSYLLLMWRAGAAWSWFGYYWPFLFFAAFITVTAVSLPKLKNRPWLPGRKIRPWLEVIFLWSVGALVGRGIPPVFSARSCPREKTVPLLFPLRHGVFHVAHGGSNGVMNQHFPVPAQRYALDITELNAAGMRAGGLIPRDLSEYKVYGAEVLSPCSGEVLAAESSLPDRVPPSMDAENLLGNHVVVFCQGSSILMAHLKPDSVLVKQGDIVREGDVVGRVGNSGNTSEPHLHIHAVSGRHFLRREVAGVGEGVPMLFNGKFLIRNDRVFQP